MLQRQLCRSLFLLLCVAPTLAVAGWTAASFSPAWHHAKLEQLGRQLGVRMECQAAETPRPGLVRLHELRLVDPELDVQLARCNLLECQYVDGTLSLAGPELRIDAGRRREVAQLVDRLLRSDWLPAARLDFQQVELAGDDGQALVSTVGSFRAVRIALSNLGEQPVGRELRARGHTAKHANSSWRLTATRNRQLDPPATRLEIETGPAGLPWGLLTGGAVIDESDRALFSGRCSMTLNGADSAGSAEGELRGVSLSPWAAGIELAAPATVRVEQVHWSGERLVAFDAMLSGARGTIDRNLVYAIHSQLRCGSTDQLAQDWAATHDAPIPFDELAIAIRFDEDGVVLRGGCHDATGQPMPALLARGGRPLLYHPADERLVPGAVAGIGELLPPAVVRYFPFSQPTLRR